jgi:DNA-binding transcriptional LysR family regulator
MDRLSAMAAFIAIVDEGGFAAAARKLGQSPPAVTRAVAELESRMGVRLLTRTTRSVRLTDAGTRYAADCRRILADVADSEASTIGAHSQPRGHLVVTAPVLFGSMYVMPIVAEYLDRYPETDVSCWYVDRVVNLIEEGIDVAIRIGELADSSLQAVGVGRVDRVVCASRRYLKRHGVPREPRELGEHRIVSAGAVTPTQEWSFVAEGRPLRVRIRPRLSTTSNDSAIAAALGGFGITRVLSYQIAPHLEAGKLERVLKSYEPPPLPIHVVHREGRHAAQKARAFVDLAIERLRSDVSLR